MKTISAVHVNILDNCVTLTGNAEAGDAVVYLEGDAEMKVIARENVPAWHKVATTHVEKGGSVYKYGEIIGAALVDIEAGDHVHIHNLRSVQLI